MQTPSSHLTEAWRENGFKSQKAQFTSAFTTPTSQCSTTISGTSASPFYGPHMTPMYSQHTHTHKSDNLDDMPYTTPNMPDFDPAKSVFKAIFGGGPRTTERDSPANSNTDGREERDPEWFGPPHDTAGQVLDRPSESVPGDGNPGQPEEESSGEGQIIKHYQEFIKNIRKTNGHLLIKLLKTIEKLLILKSYLKTIKKLFANY